MLQRHQGLDKVLNLYTAQVFFLFLHSSLWSFYITLCELNSYEIHVRFVRDPVMEKTLTQLWKSFDVGTFDQNKFRHSEGNL